MATSNKYTKKSKEAEEAAATGTPIIEQPKRFIIYLGVKSDTNLIQNCFNQKTVEELLRKHLGLAVQREPKKPREIIERAIIRNVDGVVCMPTTAFKKAIVHAVGGLGKGSGITMKKARSYIFIRGGAVPIKYEMMTPRLDMVRVGGKPDTRFRPEFHNWSARIGIEYSEQINVQLVVDLLNRAGAVGVGEWRPEKDGNFGTFHVSECFTDKAVIDEIENECRPALPGLRIPDWAMDAEIDPALLKKIAGGAGEADEADTPLGVDLSAEQAELNEAREG